MLKGVSKDCRLNWSHEIEEVIAKVWDEPTVDEVQSAFHKRMNRLV
jgi:hypothetical protein